MEQIWVMQQPHQRTAFDQTCPLIGDHRGGLDPARVGQRSQCFFQVSASRLSTSSIFRIARDLGATVIRIGWPNVKISSQSRKTICVPARTALGSARAYVVRRCEIDPIEEQGSPNCLRICEMASSEQCPSSRSNRIYRSTSLRIACADNGSQISNV